ncbi:MAG TPA: DUF6265 family protein [Thermoanaerobaculia bacterium]|nr:DUF6265 family protein [Thermoanaerobaculia bacterium]
MRATLRPLARAAASAAVLVASAVPAAAETPAAEAAAAAPLRVADLGWLAGSWRGSSGEAPIEEQWTAPDDGVMVGVFRWGRGEEMYEILLLEDTPDGVALRIRHFGPGLLVAWEEKDAPAVFRPVEHGDGWALFAEEGDDEEATRLLYRREADGGLTVRVIEKRGGEDAALDFAFRPLGG